MSATRKASVVWELSDEGRVVVDVDAPLRPFGSLPTPPKGVGTPAKKDGTEPDGAPVFENVDDLPPPPFDDKK